MNRFKHLHRRGLALLMALVLCMTMLPTAALAADEEPVKEETEAVADAAAGEAEDSEDAAPAGGEEEGSVDAKPAGDKEDGSEDTNPAGGETEEEDSEDAEPAVGETEEENSEDSEPAEDEASEDAVVYATVEEFLAAMEAIGNATDESSNALAVENCLAVYARLSPEDQAAMAEYYEALLTYQADPDDGIDTLASYKGTVTLYGTPETAIKSGPTYGSKVKIDLGTRTGQSWNNVSYRIPQVSEYFELNEGWTIDYVSVAGNSSGKRQPGASFLLSMTGGSMVYYFKQTAVSKTFTLNYNANGGSGAPAQQTATSTASSYNFTISNEQPTRTGYDFLGWSTSSSATTPNYYGGGTINVTGTTTLYAVWKQAPEKVTLTYMDRGSEYRKDSYDKGTEVTVVTCTNTHGSYTFKGWDTNPAAATVVYGAGNTFMLSVDTTLYAVWEKKDQGPASATYTVEWYDVEGETIKPTETRTGTVGSTVKVTDADKVVQGYTFHDGNTGNILSDTLKVSGTILRLYFTKDAPKITVTWKDGYTDAPIKVEEIERDSDYSDLYPEDPTREGYDFTGWGEPETDKDGNITITAQWKSKDGSGSDEASYTVEWYDTEGNSIKAAETRTGVVGGTVEVTDADKVVQGYTFQDDNPENILSDTLAVSGTILRLYFTKDETPPPHEDKITVTWKDGYTDTPIKVEEIDRGGDYSELYPEDPTREGYDFTGWGEPETDEDGSITITAQWKPKDTSDPDEASYTVEWYDTNGNRIKAAETRTGTVGNTVSATAADRIVSGYTFAANDPRNMLSAELAESGTVLRLYFNRNTAPTDPTDPTPETPDPVIPTPPPAPTPMPVPTPTAPVDNTTTINDEEVPLAAPGLNSVDHYAYIIGYTDGLVHPEANITRAEVATIFFRLMTDEFRMEHWATTNSFSDVTAANWFNNGVSTSANAGIVKGYEDGSFRPNRNITRAEFAAIAARFLSEDAPGKASFSDTSGHWAEKEINRAVAAGWIKGYTDGTFRPDQPITRAEAVTLINRMLDRTPDKDHLLPDMIRWADNTEDKWYYADMQEATNSHDYEREEMILIEDWTELLEIRDWEQLEKEWSTAASAQGEEVADNLDLSKIGENA